MVVNNPNNWHWVDKNCIDWAKAYFAKLVGTAAESGNTSVAVSAVSLVEGDVEVCQRKGKVISLFDLRLVFSIEGKVGKDEVKGSVTVPELAYDTEADEIQFDTSIYNESPESEPARALIKKELVPKIRDFLLKFGTDLIATHGLDIQLESDKVSSKLTKENQGGVVAPKQARSEVPKETKALSAPFYNTSTLHLEPTFNTTAEQLYITLLDAQRVAAWLRLAPQMEPFPPKEGSAFTLFGGLISGKFTKLVPNERVVQLWRLEDWKKGHYATLDITLEQGLGETLMVVKWLGIPVGEEDRVRGNFEDYYIRSIKVTFGFGAVL